MIEKIQEKIDKYKVLERASENHAECDLQFLPFHLIGEFLGDLNKLLESAKEKKKACCEKKNGKQITVTACRNCPYLCASTLIQDYCKYPKSCGRGVFDCDTIPDWCPL